MDDRWLSLKEIAEYFPRCGFGKERVDKCLGITGFAHSGPAAPQYGKRVPIFPAQAYLDAGDRGQEIVLDFSGQAAIP